MAVHAAAGSFPRRRATSCPSAMRCAAAPGSGTSTDDGRNRQDVSRTWRWRRGGAVYFAVRQGPKPADAGSIDDRPKVEKSRRADPPGSADRFRTPDGVRLQAFQPREIGARGSRCCTEHSRSAASDRGGRTRRGVSPPEVSSRALPRTACGMQRALKSAKTRASAPDRRPERRTAGPSTASATPSRTIRSARGDRACRLRHSASRPCSPFRQPCRLRGFLARRMRPVVGPNSTARHGRTHDPQGRPAPGRSAPASGTIRSAFRSAGAVAVAAIRRRCGRRSSACRRSTSSCWCAGW